MPCVWQLDMLHAGREMIMMRLRQGSKAARNKRLDLAESHSSGCSAHSLRLTVTGLDRSIPIAERPAPLEIGVPSIPRSLRVALYSRTPPVRRICTVAPTTRSSDEQAVCHPGRKSAKKGL